jgi:hypothetical protein
VSRVRVPSSASALARAAAALEREKTVELPRQARLRGLDLPPPQSRLGARDRGPLEELELFPAFHQISYWVNARAQARDTPLSRVRGAACRAS